MKRSIKLIAFVLLLGFTLWKCSTQHSAVKGGLPQDVYASCTLSADTFKTWFAGNQVTLNGLVTPANSVAFPHQNNCDFYKWSERMFLWATSPVKSGLVLTSPEFYNVTPPDSAGNRYLIQPAAGAPVKMNGHISKFGPNRLPVVKDKKGRFFEIEKSQPKETVKDATGNIVEVDHIIATAAHAFTFVDKAGKTITHPQAVIQHSNNPGHFVHRFLLGKKSIFLDAQGNVIDSEEGQATGDALMSQSGSLVYYLTLVNDVYAEYLNLAKSDPSMRKKFPTTAADRDLIYAYALLHHVILPHPNALAIEIKSSWVEASTLAADSSNYVLMTATVPKYAKTNSADTMWVPKGDTTLRVALVGMHIAGSVAGHPEMIWSTFEHQNNTPNAAYSYLNTKKDTVNVPQDGGTGWLFTANAADTVPNQSYITTNDPSIVNGPNTDTLFAQPTHTISASNTLRTMPWGSQSAAGAYSNQQDTTSAASNSEILSINNAIHGMLAKGDVRANYLLIGAVWTPNGTAPTGYGYAGTVSPGITIGTSVLANSTMETYFQSPTQSCFTCHSNNPGTPTLSPDTISHVFANIQPFALVFNPADTIKNKKKK
ncbi:hypothetical protein KXQ82_17765 [Mucilaginibacter sp. HMF5004]|uniref:hypothetical protein n=1 Tax=Mucilaginibacter rivuli TaxID=2857527 RepID=UPI001C606270|nr:hypothetical protein [Mucilaginibacter rivuli]MBW4891578.1 hypothetical protein [Mucilaginibacter rivuli]